MTLQGIYERVVSDLPGVSFNRVKDEVNGLLEDFATRSRSVRYEYEPAVSGLTYTLPAGTVSLIEVTLFDASGTDISADFTINFDVEAMSVEIRDYDGSVLAMLPSNVMKIRLTLAKVPATVVAPTDVPGIPTRYHGALVNGVLAAILAVKEPRIAQACEVKYERAVLNAKIHTNMVGSVERGDDDLVEI